MAVLAGLLTLCACHNTKPEGDNKPDAKDPPSIRPSTRVPVDEFVADQQFDSSSGEILGPLESYKLFIDEVIDPDKRATITNGKLVGEGVVFGLRGAGDTGAFHVAAFERAVQLYSGTKYEDVLATEDDSPGSMALVKFETPGYPSGMKGDSPLPVVIIPQGNATSIAGGRMYDTYLTDDRTGKLLGFREYGAILEEDVKPFETYFYGMGDVDFDATDPSAVVDSSGKPIDVRKVIGRGASTTKYVLANGFKLTTEQGWEEPGRASIELHITPGGRGLDDAEYLTGVYDALVANKLGFRVFRNTNAPRTLTIVPTICKDDINRVYDRIRVTRFDVRPTTRLHIIVDDQNGRIMIVGPERLRNFTGTVTLGKGDILPPPPNAKDPRPYNPSGNFRVVAEPANDGKDLRVSWSRFENDNLAASGERTIKNDVGGLLRLVYGEGMEPDDCVHLMLKAARQGLRATVSANPKRIKPDSGGTGAGSSK